MKTSRMMNTIPNPLTALTPRRLLLVVHQQHVIVVVAPYHTWTVWRSRDLSFMQSSSQEVTFLPSKGFMQLRVSEMKSMSCWIWKIILISSNLCTCCKSIYVNISPAPTFFQTKPITHLHIVAFLLLTVRFFYLSSVVNYQQTMATLSFTKTNNWSSNGCMELCEIKLLGGTIAPSTTLLVHVVLHTCFVVGKGQAATSPCLCVYPTTARECFGKHRWKSYQISRGPWPFSILRILSWEI